MRSGYVHELKPIVSQLRVPVISQQDAFRWELEPYLTLSGLVRLSEHILRNFIERGESVGNENVNWREQLPGVIKMKMSPEYWIHHAASFSSNHAVEWYGAFLEHLVGKLRANEPIVEMTAVMERIKVLVGSANAQQKTAMLCLYCVYNAILPTALKVPKWDTFLQGYEYILDRCCIETVSARFVLGVKREWSFQECVQCYEAYNLARFSKVVTHIPNAFEIAFLVAIANKALAEGKQDQHVAYLGRAIVNCPGLSAIQTILRDAASNATAVNYDELLFGRPILGQAVKVTFSFFNCDGEQVTLCGDFNGWAPDATPMKRHDDGHWEASLDLIPGRYEYKFLVDGNWISDPLSSENTLNEFGTLNSVCEVRG
jgi:hypothetical protein